MGIDNVADITPRLQYVASAAQTAFDYNFSIFTSADLVVVVDGVTKALDTDYTVDRAEEEDTDTETHGGTVTFLTPMTGGEIVTIYRDIAIERPTDISQNGPWSSTAYNDEQDKTYLIMQQIQANVDRSLRIPIIAEVASDDIVLEPANFAGMYLAFDADGKPTPAALSSSTMTQSTIGQLFYPQTQAERDAGVTPANYYYAPGNVLRYGTNTTPGTTDMTTAIQAALDSNTDVFIPAGTYKTTATLNWHPYQHVYGESHTVSIIKPAGTNLWGFEFDYENEASGPQACHFHDFAILGDNVTGTTLGSVGGIHWTGSSHSSVIERVQFRNFDNSNQCGLYFSGQVYYVSTSDCEFVDCMIGIYANGNNVTVSQTPSCNGIRIIKPRIEMSGLSNSAGISLANAKNTQIIGGYIEACNLYGITCDTDSDRTHIEGVWFEQNASRDIRLNGCEFCTVTKTHHYRTTAHTSNISIELAGGGSHHVYDVHCDNRTGASTTQPVYLNSTAKSLVEKVYSDLSAGVANVYSGTIDSNRVVDQNTSNTQEIGGVYRNFLGGGIRVGDSATVDAVTVNGILYGSKTWDPPSVAAGGSTTTTITVTGAALGDTVIPAFTLSLSGLTLTGYVSSANTATVVLANNTAGAVDLSSGSISACVIKW